MSATRIKLLAAESTNELEYLVNNFLSLENIELKQMDYETDGL